MKFIHTSDWHLGQSFYHCDREEEHRHFFRQLAKIIKKEEPDALLVSGDVFHIATPSAQAQRLYVEGMLSLHEAYPAMRIILTAGNHDSSAHIEALRKLWEHTNATVIGFPEFDDEGNVNADKLIVTVPEFSPNNDYGYVIAVPYIRPKHYHIFKDLQEIVVKECEKDAPIVMMAHLSVLGASMVGQDLTIGGIDAIGIDDFGNDYDYLALGHIHSPQFIKGSKKARYCGTPVQTSFDEDFKHTISIVEIAKRGDEPTVREVEIANRCQFLTVPKEAKPFDEVIHELEKIPNNTEGYLRVHTLVKDILPVDAETTVARILEKKKIKQCCFQVEVPKTEQEAKQQTISIQQLKEISPLTIAQTFYKTKKNQEMPKKLVHLFEQACKEAASTDE